MKRFVLLASLPAMLCAADTAPASKPTFTKDIAPIFYASCVSCHRAGEIAPMQLTTYEQVRPWAAAIKASVAQRKMPPWFADPKYGKFTNDHSLTEKQIATIVAWANSGAPKGDDKDLPPMPKLATGWSHNRPPDLVVEMPLEVTIPATGQMDLTNYYVKIPLTEEKYVEAVELRPDNRTVVHHSIVNVVSLPDNVTPEQLIAGKKLGRTGWKLIGQAPGKGFETHPEGVAKRLIPGAYFEFNMHYTPNGKGEAKDRSRLGLWFSKTPPHHEVVTRAAAEEVYLADKKVSRGGFPRIPPNASDYPVVIGHMNVKDDITLYSLSPHMHWRGKDMKYVVRTADGKEETILFVPGYNFDWQLNYEFEKPVKIPAGSKLIAIAHYDNSKNNPYNPAPDQEVIWGQQSWNEMFVPWTEFTVDKADLRKLSRAEIDKILRPAARVIEQEQ
jgi:mono/diheme cytochrome c family protein